MKFIHAHNYCNTNKSSMDFYVNSCGYYSKPENGSETYRPKGRSDYQLIYIIEGRLYAEHKGIKTRHSQGEVIIYRPGESQHYYSGKEDNLSYYWIHFNGPKVEKLFTTLGFCGKRSFYAPVNKDDIKLIYRMTEEIHHNLPGNDIMLESLFLQLCTDIARRSGENSKSLNNYSQLSNAIHSMEHNPAASYDIDDYANMCGMSRFHFMHIFKTTTGKSPIEYRNSLRIAQGANMLIHTDMSIKSISEYTGFNDPLYFSRYFKSKYKMSPSEYRAKAKEF